MWSIDHRTRRLAGVVMTTCAMAVTAAPRARADMPFSIVPQPPMVSTPGAASEEQAAPTRRA